MVNVTVVTPTLPERSSMLAEVIDDVARQSEPCRHLIEVDHLGEGPAKVRNRMLGAVHTPWVAFVDDDDRINDAHIATLLEHSDAADVIYTLGRVSGREWEIPHDCKLADLDAVNTVPVTALVRWTTLVEAGGFPEGEHNEDHGLWRRIKARGGRFRCVHEYTWLYRFTSMGNRSLDG